MLLLCSGANASTIESVTQDVKAYGQTRHDAIINGLIESIQRIHGVEVEAIQRTRNSLREIIVSENGGESLRAEYDAETFEDISLHTNGLIESYDVLDSQITRDTKEWKVTLRVTLPIYRGDTYSDRATRTIAIMPFRSASHFNRAPGVDPSQITRNLRGEIEQRLRQGSHFLVLDRQHEEEWAQERDRLVHGNVGVREIARLGQQLGTDYLVVGEVSEVVVDSRRQQLYGTMVTSHEVSLTVAARVIEFATRRVAWAETIHAHLDPRAVRERLGPSSDPLRAMPQLVEEVATEIARLILDAAYPIRILELLDSKTVYLNQGKGRLQFGDELRIPGEERKIPDPGTERFITVRAPDIARLKVVEVLPGYSIAELTHGTVENVEAGRICLRQ